MKNGVDKAGSSIINFIAAEMAFIWRKSSITQDLYSSYTPIHAENLIPEQTAIVKQ
jgi:hypothetical protein